MYQDTVPLFVWNDEAEGWVWVADGVVDEAREFIVADVSHFCTYVALSYPDGAAVRSVFYSYFDANPAGDTPGESTVSWWRAASNIEGRNHNVGGECYVDEDGFFSFGGSATSSEDSSQVVPFGVSGSINADTGVVYCAGGGVTATGTVGASSGSGT